jgi:hypothetical protein
MRSSRVHLLMSVMLAHIAAAEVAAQAANDQAANDQAANAQAATDQAANDQAAKPASNPLSGVWLHAADAKEEKVRLEAIAAAVEEMPFFIKGTASERLKERTVPAPRIELTVDEQHFEIGGQKGKLTLRFGAKPVVVERNGRAGKVAVLTRKGRVVVEAAGENGRRETTYVLSPDQKQLTLKVRMTGERLAAPLVYQATYRRQ